MQRIRVFRKNEYFLEILRFSGAKNAYTINRYARWNQLYFSTKSYDKDRPRGNLGMGIGIGIRVYSPLKSSLAYLYPQKT